MMQKIKKTVSILLSVIMVFSLFTIVPFSAYAADNYNAATQADVQAVFNDGGTVKLGADITTTGTLTVASGKTVTLDLNGCGIIGTGKYSVITVQNGANLTITDSNPDAVHGYRIPNPATNGAGLATVHSVKQEGDTDFTGGFITGGQGTDGNNGNVYGYAPLVLGAATPGLNFNYKDVLQNSEKQIFNNTTFSSASHSP